MRSRFVFPFAGLSKDTFTVLGLFIALALMVYGRPLFSGQELYFRDLQIFFGPGKQFLGESLRAGHLPLWNPNVQMGGSFLADPQSGVLYPFSLIFLFADAPRGIAFSLALHLVIAQAGLYALARHYGFSHWPAVAGAIIYGLGGWMLSTGNLPPFAHSAAWAPWTILACERLWHSPRPGRIAVCALALAMQMYAGWPEMFLFLAAILAARRFATPGLLNYPWLLAQLAALFLAAALFAPQFLATWENYQLSARNNGMSQEALLEYSATISQWRSLLIPPPLSSDNWNILQAFPDGHVPLFLSMYLGWAAFLLVIAGLGRSRHALSWIAVIGFGVFMALGAANPLAVPLIELTNRFRSPEKYLFLVHMGAALLATAGVAKIIGRFPERYRLGIGLGLAAALAAELSYVNSNISLLAPPNYFAVGKIPEAQSILRDPGRIYTKVLTGNEPDTVREVYAGFRANLSPNLGTMAHLSYLDGVSFIQPRQHETVLRLLDMSPPGELLARRLGFLGTKYLITDDPAISNNARWTEFAQPLTSRLWQIRESAPHLSFPNQILAAPDYAVFGLSAQQEFARGDTVFVSPGSIPTGSGLAGMVRPVELRPGHIEAEVGTASGGLMVLRENFYPGWTATVDGRETPIVRTNRFFMGVPIPAGQHTVVFDYVPTHWHAGLACAGLAALALSGLAIVGLRNNRR